MRHTAALVAVLICAAGCASSGRSRSADTVTGVNTIDQELAAADAQLGKTVDALGSLVETAGPDMNKKYDQFEADLADLDSKVQSIRDRALALNTKRDAYLQAWLQQTSQIKSEDLKKAAEQRRTQLQGDFMDLNAKGTSLKKAYAPVQASLHDCQRFLEADLNPSGVKALSGEVDKLKQGRGEVEAAVKEFRASLKSIADKLSIPAPAPEKAPGEPAKK
jgi:chromosome segregation ATPase